MRKYKVPHGKMAAVLLGILTALCFGAVGIGQHSITAEAASRVDLNYLMEKYPDGKYWNHVGMAENNIDGWTDYPCEHPMVYNGHGGYYFVPNGTCNAYCDDIQCGAFVDKLATECFGTMYFNRWPTITLDQLKPGDAVWFMNGNHYIFITGVDGEKVTYGECNGNYQDCKIRWNLETTKSAIAATLVKAYSAPSELTVNLENRSTVSTNKLSYGNNVTLKGIACGGKGNYQYEFSVQKPSTKTFAVVQRYSKSQYCTYHPWESGTYKMRVNVRDAAGTVDSKTFTFTVTASTLKNTSAMTTKTLSYGENAKFTLSASGGTGGYQYKITAVKPSGANVTLRNYSYSKDFIYHPWESGQYTITIAAKDGSGNVKEKTFTFTVKAQQLQNKTTISASSISYGENVTFQFSAAGGTGGYQYRIDMYKPSAENWATLKNYNAATAFTYHPWEEGKYLFRISVKDRTNNVITRQISMNVVVKPLVNLSSVEETVILGNDTLITLGAEGGSLRYRYTLQVYDPSLRKWTTLLKSSTETQYLYHPQEAGRHVFRIVVSDTLGYASTEKLYMTVEELSEEQPDEQPEED